MGSRSYAKPATTTGQISDALAAMTPTATANNDETLLFNQIAKQINEFIYSPESDHTFQVWYDRFEPYIINSKLSDELKVRILIDKLF